MKKDKEIVPVIIEEMIFIIRGKRVMLDTHLAELYQVPTMRLNEQMKRNKARFPEDFAFQLVQEEYESLKSQIAISKKGRGGRRYLPYVFTEQGVAMLSSVLRSGKAIQMSIFIVRAFIKLSELLLTNKDVALKLNELEYKQKEQGNQILNIHHALAKLINPPERIGFKTDSD